MDKQIAEMRAREVPGVFSVENHLMVANGRTESTASNAGPQSGNNGQRQQ
jgi:hypothetical protein